MTDLEQQIAEQREKAEKAMREGDQDKARAHYQNMAGLISMRTDERVGQMEREKGLR